MAHVYAAAIPGVDNGPPTEFRVFPFGEIKTTKGVFVFDDESARRVMAAWRAYGNRLAIDYEHQTLSPVTNGPVPAAGWFDLEVREDGLYAVNVEWTDRAAKLLSAKEYRYFSPTFKVEDGKVTELINIALTNLPATRSMEPLVAKAVPFRAGELVDGEWDAAAAVARVRRWASSDGSGEPDTIDWARYRQAFAWYDEANAETFGAYKLPHHDVRGGRLVVHRRGVIAAAAALQGSRGGVDIPAGDRQAVRDHLARHYEQWGGSAPWEVERMNGIMQALGLGDGAGEAEALSAVVALRQTVDELIRLTGKANAEEALGVVRAWQTAAEERERLAAELERMRAEALNREREQLIEAALNDGRLPPALVEWAREASIETLRAYLKHAPRVVAASAAKPEEKAGSLTDEEREVIAQLGISEQEYVSLKGDE